jgi:hypothetical protein
MKKLLLTSAMLVACAGAFAQGKVNFIGDLNSLITLGPGALAADSSLQGQPVGNTTSLPSGQILQAGLYGGTSQGNLFLYSVFTLTSSAPGSAGLIGPLHIVLNALPNGAPAIPGIANATPIGATTPWFQVRVWSTTAANNYPSYEAAVAGGAPYWVSGPMFQMNPGPSIGYVNTSPGVNSSWTDGSLVVPTPEPSTFALAGLGAAALMILRRRK